MGEGKKDNELKPAPVRWVRLQFFDERHRRIHCVNYDKCLYRAAKGAWEGFSCSLCEVKEEIPSERDDSGYLREVWETIECGRSADGGAKYGDNKSA